MKNNASSKGVRLFGRFICFLRVPIMHPRRPVLHHWVHTRLRYVAALLAENTDGLARELLEPLNVGRILVSVVRACGQPGRCGRSDASSLVAPADCGTNMRGISCRAVLEDLYCRRKSEHQRHIISLHWI